MRFSVIVPAHNEEVLLPACLRSIGVAASRAGVATEVIVVANRCRDTTVAVARRFGARVIDDDSRSIAAVRNAGARRALGDAIVTIDADSLMHEDALVQVDHLLAMGRYVGGGCSFRPERMSVGIWATMAVTRAAMAVSRLGGAMYWCLRSDFDAVGGFDEKLTMAEDVDFARRLRAYGLSTNRRFVNLRKTPVVTSCRKFDRFGDWHMLGLVRHAGEVRASLNGLDTRFVDRYFYDFNG